MASNSCSIINTLTAWIYNFPFLCCFLLKRFLFCLFWRILGSIHRFFGGLLPFLSPPFSLCPLVKEKRTSKHLLHTINSLKQAQHESQKLWQTYLLAKWLFYFILLSCNWITFSCTPLFCTVIVWFKTGKWWCGRLW